MMTEASGQDSEKTHLDLQTWNMFCPCSLLFRRRCPIISRDRRREEHLANSFRLDYGEDYSWSTLQNPKRRKINHSHKKQIIFIHSFHSIETEFIDLRISTVLRSKPDWATEMGSTNGQHRILQQQRNGEPSLRGGGSVQKAKKLVLPRIHLPDSDNQSMLAASHSSPYQEMH